MDADSWLAGLVVDSNVTVPHRFVNKFRKMVREELEYPNNFGPLSDKAEEGFLMANATTTMPLRVAKFGGTSMKDAEAIIQSARVAAQQGAVILVVSATSGTTDQLIELGNDPSRGEAIITRIKNRHDTIASELKASSDIREAIGELYKELEEVANQIAKAGELTPEALDELQGMGERLSSPLMVQALRNLGHEQVELLDSRDIISTDDRYGAALPNFEQIKADGNQLREQLTNTVFVAQGFIGRSPDGKTTTLGRGGSDYSAALFAEAVSADELQIWTDVAGVATTDPRLVKGAERIEEISFQEAAELATSGAKILHPPTMIPARRSNIPVFVGSTFEPEAGGTWIRKTAESQPLVRAITIRRNQSLLTMTTPRMSQQFGFLGRIFSIFEKYKISVDQVSTSEISVAVTVDDGTLSNSAFLDEVNEIADIEIEEGLSLVSLIGNRVNYTSNLALDIFASLQEGQDGIVVRLICQGASKHNFCFLVPKEHGEEAVKRLHKEFIG